MPAAHSTSDAAQQLRRRAIRHDGPLRRDNARYKTSGVLTTKVCRPELLTLRTPEYLRSRRDTTPDVRLLWRRPSHGYRHLLSQRKAAFSLCPWRLQEGPHLSRQDLRSIAQTGRPQSSACHRSPPACSARCPPCAALDSGRRHRRHYARPPDRRRPVAAAAARAIAAVSTGSWIRDLKRSLTRRSTRPGHLHPAAIDAIGTVAARLTKRNSCVRHQPDQPGNEDQVPSTR